MEFIEWMLKDIKLVWENRYALIIIGVILILFIILAPYLPNNSSMACQLNSTMCNNSTYRLR